MIGRISIKNKYVLPMGIFLTVFWEGEDQFFFFLIYVPYIKMQDHSVNFNYITFTLIFALPPLPYSDSKFKSRWTKMEFEIGLKYYKGYLIVIIIFFFSSICGLIFKLQYTNIFSVLIFFNICFKTIF